MSRNYSKLTSEIVIKNARKIIAPIGALFLMAAPSLTNEAHTLPHKMRQERFKPVGLSSKAKSGYEVDFLSNNVQLRTGDPVRDAIMQQAIFLLATRDNATKDSELNHFLSHDLAERDHVKLEPGSALPHFGNDICGLLVSAVFEVIQHPACIKVFPFTYEGHQALRAYNKLNPVAVHDIRSDDPYEPKPGDVIITNHAGGSGSHAAILLGFTKDASGTDFYTLDMGRVNPKEDKEHDVVFSHFKFDGQIGRFARVLKDGSFAPRSSVDISNEPDNIHVINISALPNYDKLRNYISNNPKPPMVFPSFGGAHPGEAAKMRQELLSLLPHLTPWQYAGYRKVQNRPQLASNSQLGFQ